MNDKNISADTVNSVEELAQLFSKVVKRNYMKNSKFWRATSMNNQHEVEQWNSKIETEAEIVEANAYAKILEIIREPKKHKSFFVKKMCFFKSKTVISITKTSGFYDDLLEGKSIRYAAAANVEYLIDTKHLCVNKVIYSQYEIL